MCVRMGGGEGGGMKAINIQRLGEREEGGQRGTEDGILLLCVLHPVFLYHSTTCLFILFIYLSFFMFSQSPSHLVWTPHPFHTTPPPHPHPTKPHCSSSPMLFFGPFAVTCCCSLCQGCPLQITRTHKHIHTHTQTDRQCFSFCFLKVQLLLLISCFVGLTFAYLGLRTEVAKPCAVSPSLST